MPFIARQHEPDPAIRALLDMVAARTGCAAVGLVDGDGALTAATPAFRALPRRTATDLSRGLAGVAGIATVIPAGGLGPQGGFWAAIAAATQDGAMARHLLIVDPRRRRLTPGIAAAMADGALILGRMVATPAAAPGAPARADRAAAVRWITATLRAQRPAGESALLLLDLDRFHALNEVLGTTAGDRVLARIAARIAGLLGPGERLLRLDGDRFAILAERAGADPRSLADRLLRAVAMPMELDGRSVTVEASIGIVDRITEASRAATLLPQGAAALRRAKNEGRNRYVLHVPAIDTLDLERSRLEFDLAHALAEGQMQLVFQPYVSLAPDAFADAVAGAEALLRWQHPTRGEMRPASFVPLAEASGLILPLGAWTLRRALEAASRWPDRLMLAVNISALQFHQSRFVAEVDAALASTGFPAERLELEITETVLMRDNPQTVGQLRALIARGIRIALDDFGTGYSALAYLARLPHHRIKLGRSFIQDLANPATAELIRAIVASARAQGIAITAEGAETPAQLEAVRAMGFTHAQGYVIGVPVADPSELFAPATA